MQKKTMERWWLCCSFCMLERFPERHGDGSWHASHICSSHQSASYGCSWFVHPSSSPKNQDPFWASQGPWPLVMPVADWVGKLYKAIRARCWKHVETISFFSNHKIAAKLPTYLHMVVWVIYPYIYIYPLHPILVTARQVEFPCSIPFHVYQHNKTWPRK